MAHEPAGGAARSRRPPMLLALVFAASLALVGVTAGALVAIVSAHIATASINATISRDSSLVELFVNGSLRRSDLVAPPAAARSAELNAALAALTGDDQLLNAEIRSPQGWVLFASDPGAVGSHAPVTRGMATAAAGQSWAAMTPSTDQPARLAPDGSGATIEEFLPIVGSDGATVAVFAISRDAGPVVAGIEAAQLAVMLVVTAAGIVLAIVLAVIFRAAQARISLQQQQLVDASRRDGLTDLPNHGAIVASLSDAIEGARESGTRLCVALLDVDNFRLFNDTHGHQAGDAVLLRVADLVDAAATDDLSVARYGPDEFLLLCTGEANEAVVERVGRLQRSLADVTMQLPDTERLPVSLSAGVAAFPDHANSVTGLLSAAAQALQEAKASGGDSVRVADAGEAGQLPGSFDVLSGLVIAVDTKDRYTKRHSEDVARYAVFLGRRLGFAEELLDAIRVAGLLHDVGKIGVPDVLLRKPGKLTAEEFEIFKQHVALGDAIVKDLADVDRVRDGIRNHHERWDGRGYLAGLSGEEIPLIGRVLAVADAFSAMTTTRPYRKAQSVEEAIRRLGDAAGTQLEETLVVEFIRGLESDPAAPLPGSATPPIWLPTSRVA